jgi:hypothetical protein
MADTLLSLSTLHTITNCNQLPINVLKPSNQGIFDGFLDLSLDESESGLSLDLLARALR